MNFSALLSDRKVRWFAIFSSIGCLLGAIVGEGPYRLLMPPAVHEPATPQIDVLFLLDATGSMQSVIDDVQRGIISFAKELETHELDTRIALIAFRDNFLNEPTETVRFDGSPFTKEYSEFQQQVGRIRATGGGDIPESALDTIMLASAQPFRPEAIRIILLITDAPPHIPDRSTRSITEARQAFALLGLDHVHLHLVVPSTVYNHYKPLQEGVAVGDFFPLDSVGSGEFARIMPEIGQTIGEAVTSLVSGNRVPAGHKFRITFAAALWTAFLAMGCTLHLIVGQNAYLKRALFPYRTGGIAVGCSALVGLFAGAISEAIFPGTTSHIVVSVFGRLIGWTLMGGLLGLGLAWFIPNLKPLRGVAGGAVGGALGMNCFLVLGLLSGDMLGRLAGAAAVGLCIGAMIALFEAVLREAWLEVEYGPGEIRKVSLGREPVAVGSDASRCTVYLRQAAPVALEYTLRDGTVTCRDVPRGRETTIPPGDVRTIEGVRLCVKAANFSRPDESVNPQQTVHPPGHSGMGTGGSGAAQPVPSGARGPLQFIIQGRKTDLTLGTRLRVQDIPGLESTTPGKEVAEVVTNPQDPSILGLKNLMSVSWESRTTDGRTLQIDPGRSTKLMVGTRIRFGNGTEGVVL